MRGIDKDPFHSKFQKKIRKMIDDSKKFNAKIDDFIRDTERRVALPPPRINRGTIRLMEARDKRVKENKLKQKQEAAYISAKKQYEKDMHEIMEEIIEMKKNILL